jgi:thiamine-monophosphate kinase
MREFELIDRYFHAFVDDPTVLLGIGDDGAIVSPHSGKNLVVCVDTLVSGTHYLADTPAEVIAEKALAVNLSDLAAMGAAPKWFTLALSRTAVDEVWLDAFSRGLKMAAEIYQVALIGGDTTSGCDAVTIQVMGEIEPQKALLRSGAKADDMIVVSGQLGGAVAGLSILRNQVKMHDKVAREQCIFRHQQPVPRLALGQALVDLATSAIDISDGLLADLGHILERSQMGATIYADKIPVDPALEQGPWNEQDRLSMALTGGDDYELCFTVPAEKISELVSLAARLKISLTVIGKINADAGLHVLDQNGQDLQFTSMGWQHF